MAFGAGHSLRQGLPRTAINARD